MQEVSKIEPKVKSMLRGKKPTTIEKRFKALFYGCAGAGKTIAAIQFPRPYLIDTERGAENDEYTSLLEKQGGVIFQTTDFDELLQEVKFLLTEKHEYKTLIIDPLTTLYNSLLDTAGDRVGTEFGRHYGEANKKVKRLLGLLTRLDMNVIITSHSKNEYGDGMKVTGETYDCYKKLDYLFDLVIQIQKKGKQRVGVVKKSRIKSFEELESFPFSYDTIAEKYGKKLLERDAIAQILASPEQVQKLTHLVNLLKVDNETVEKWLSKAQATSFDEMEQDHIVKCIEHLENKLNPTDQKEKAVS